MQSLQSQLVELNSTLKSHYHAELLEGRTIYFQFDVAADEPFYLRAGTTDFTFSAGRCAQPSITLFVDRIKTISGLLSGHLDGMDAFMGSQYRSDGNIVLSQVLLYLFRNNTPLHVSEVKD